MELKKQKVLILGEDILYQFSRLSMGSRTYVTTVFNVEEIPVEKAKELLHEKYRKYPSGRTAGYQKRRILRFLLRIKTNYSGRTYLGKVVIRFIDGKRKEYRLVQVLGIEELGRFEWISLKELDSWATDWGEPKPVWVRR